MPATILYRDDEMLEENNDIRGSNRIRYVPWINRIIGAEQNKSDGTLKEADYKEISFDALQKFPEDQLAKILKPSQTEISTVDLISSEFKYNRVAVGVQMIISNLKNVNTSNAKASIMNSLLKQWDHGGYTGTHGNLGVAGNPNLVTMPSKSISDIKTLLAAINDGIEEMKKEENLGITDNELSGVLIGYTGKVSSILKNVFTDGSTGKALMEAAFPEPEKGEIPASLAGSTEYLELYYKPMITQWHGAIPSQYATEQGKFGLSEDALFTYETVALELEEKGCVVRIPLTFA